MTKIQYEGSQYDYVGIKLAEYIWRGPNSSPTSLACINDGRRGYGYVGMWGYGYVGLWVQS